jgi:hypothetical protein
MSRTVQYYAAGGTWAGLSSTRLLVAHGQDCPVLGCWLHKGRTVQYYAAGCTWAGRPAVLSCWLHMGKTYTILLAAHGQDLYYPAD